MSDLCRLIWCALIGLFRPRAALEAEILTRASLFGGSLCASPMSAPQSNLRSWTIGQQHHPIRTGSPAVWSFRQGQGTDFFTAEVLTLRGLVTYYVLFFIHLESRRVDIAGVKADISQRSPNNLALSYWLLEWRMLDPSSSPSADLSALTFSNDNRMVRNFRNGGLL